METFSKLAVLAGPVLILVLGLIYWFCPPKEANHRLGYRFWWGMGSVEAWQFTQKAAGIAFSVLGFVLTVVMALLCNGYRNMTPDEMILSAAKSLLWQLGLVVVCTLVLHILALILFDWKGVRRSEKRKKAK